MKPTIFAVGDEPYCLWEEDVAERTRAFLDGLDPEFFSYLLNAYMETEDEKRGSVGIRLALHHATETLFSLLGAFVQAPDCPYAWIARCNNQELREVAKRIGSGDSTLITRWTKPFLGWESVASAVLRVYETGTDKQTRAVECFGRLWAALAGELVSEVVFDEYNATKHGFRVRPGGFKLAVGRQEAQNIPAPESEMATVGQSAFGASFFKVEKLPGKGGRHIRSRRTAVNWSLERDILLLQLTQFSINNVVSALKVENGALASTCTFSRPENDDDFTRPWTYSTGVTSMNFDFALNPSSLPEVTRAQLLEELRGSKKEFD